MTTPPAVNETKLRVRYAETDKMGVVYHSNHFIWFEIGRVELLRQMGFSYRDMEDKDGRFIAVAEAKCRYRAPVYYDDEVFVRTELLNVRESVIHFGYELRRASDRGPICQTRRQSRRTRARRARFSGGRDAAAKEWYVCLVGPVPTRRETQGVEAMTWSVPVVVEVCAGMEVTAYLSAQM